MRDEQTPVGGAAAAATVSNWLPPSPGPSLQASAASQVTAPP